MAFETRSILSAVILISAALIPSTSSAHHSFAMFDNNKEVVLNGTVREFQWTNPHSWIQLVVNVRGRNVEYSIELQSPNSLTRLGWSRSSLRAGDRVRIKIHPLKSGSNGGSFVSATFPNGRVLDGQAAP